MFDIRTATGDDWEKLRDLRFRALTDSPAAFASNLEREKAFTKNDWQLRLNTGTTFIAYKSNEPIGLIGVAQFDMTEPDKFNIISMWIEPSFRGSGLAISLIEKSKDFALQKNASEIYLHVESQNFPAIRLYEKAGFKTVENTRYNPTDSEYKYLEMTMKL